jgi:hypothetical protein
MHTFTEDVGNEILVNQCMILSMLKCSGTDVNQLNATQKDVYSVFLAQHVSGILMMGILMPETC